MSLAAVKDHGLKEAASLKVTRTISEDRDTSYVFTDMRDRLVLSRQMSEGERHDTYYVYDLRDSLVCVIPPMGVELMEDEFALDSDFARRWCFTYKYDARGNLIERGVPGGGKEVMVYDPRGRVVLYADATMSGSAQRYRYTVYDSMDRVVEEGIGKLEAALETARTSIMGGMDVKLKLSQIVPLRTCTYYTSGDFPDVLYLQEDGFMWESSFCGLGATTRLKTERVWEDPAILPTGLAASEYYIDRTYFYDEHGHVVQVLETDQEGWTSRYSTAYDLMGNITARLERHTKGADEDWMKTEYTYDARGQVLSYRRTVNGIAFDEVEYAYDDLGRLASKDVVEKIEEDYSYNLQGWQTGHAVSLYGSPVTFNESLRYYDPVSASTEARYGGFISETVSSNGSSIRSMQYGYDPLGRLLSAENSAANDSEDFSYDMNGNILSASKTSASNATDTQVFTHEGNRLTSSTGTSDNSTYTYWPNGSLRSCDKSAPYGGMDTYPVIKSQHFACLLIPMVSRQ